jgi:hypothetical protein
MSYGGAATAQRAARLLRPYQLVQARDQVLTCPMYQGAALVAPVSSTWAIERPNGTVAASGAASIVASVPTATITASMLPATETRGPLWQVRWVHTFATNPITSEVVNDAALCRREWTPTLTDQDLFDRVSSLDTNSANAITSAADYQAKRDLAAGQIIRSIYEAGQRPELITTPSALHDAHLALTLALIFEDLATRLNESYILHADRYREEYRGFRQRMTFGLDRDDNGTQPSKRTGRNATLWLGGAPIH